MKFRKPFLLILAAVLVIAGISYYILASDDTVNETSDDGINYSPASDVEKTETQEHKESLTGQDETAEPRESNQGNKNFVTPIISYWGQQSDNSDFEVNGYVPGVVEQNGSCKATMTRNGQDVSQFKTSLDDAQSTSCGLIVIPRNKLTAGNWQLVLSYESDKSQGSSETVTVAVK